MIYFCISLLRQNTRDIKKYKVRQVIEFLKRDGWELVRTKGDHRQFKNKDRKGTVTVNGKLSDDLGQELLNSIWKQAGWK